MEDKEKEFILKINVDKAKNKSVLTILLLGISLFTYVIPIILGEFDFGLIFEIISFIFLLKAKKYMLKYDVDRAKRYIIVCMIPIGCILICDLLLLCSSIQNMINLTFLAYDFYFGEFFLILAIMVLGLILKDLLKADNPVKYKESTDWFYEKYEEKGGNKNV